MSQSVLERTDSFADSDANRHARPLKHAKRLTLTQPLDLELGERLSEVTVTYETYGRLSPSRDNAVLICHALDQRIALDTESGLTIDRDPNSNADVGIFVLGR